MQQPMRVVVVFAANPALTAILSATLAAMPGLRVRSFDSRNELETYLRVAPVDLLVCDFDCEAAPAGELARAVRRDPALMRQDMQIIALARSAGPHVKAVAKMQGIDEVIGKPMSPKYLLERVMARLGRLPFGVALVPPREVGHLATPTLPRHRPSRQGSVGRVRGDKVVTLFPGSPSIN